MQWIVSSLFPDSEFCIRCGRNNASVWVNPGVDGMLSIQVIGGMGDVHSVDGQYPTREAADVWIGERDGMA